ncbi:hypothetical protein [Roseateles toxinivorans]|uniref:Uncharacterized protein n=1 Tax=Roseateles toxinivorans TaxID=270368 RepID=A0A4V3CT15_9BURK|nr:hypothetical protein [Roseateles toxinivorans]TDP63218.1 hypothetical protein DES47_105221 [Roseateles toxinivorans]
MGKPRRSDRTAPDPADEPLTWGPSLGLLAVALALVAGGLVWWWQSAAPSAHVNSATISIAASGPSGPTAAIARSGAESAQAMRPAATALGPAPAAPLRIPRLRDPAGDQTPDLADYVNEGERPTMAEVITRLHQAGVHTGLGAFSPPGTRPPLIGLAVPEDFPLPPGYVRHYQATDDGQRIEPILMFAPDHQLFDAARQPIAMPKDRVVPPELAPQGLPIRRIVVPAPVESPGS